MNARPYLLVTAAIFALVSLAHLARLLGGLSVEFGGCVVPMWASWGGLVVGAALAAWGFRLARAVPRD